MQIGSGETWTQVSTTFFQTFFATPFSSPGGRCELGNWMRQVALPRRLLPRLQAEGLDRQDHQGLLRSVFNHCARMRAVKSGVNGILYCDKWMESRLKPLTPISHLSAETYLIRLGFHKKDN